MKKIIIALAVLGSTWVGAQAQTNTCTCPAKKAAAHKKLAYTAHLRNKNNNVTVSKTYQVCRYEGGYYTCCLEKSTTVKPVAVTDQLSGTAAKPLAEK